MVVSPSQHHWQAFQRADQESFLAAADIEDLVGGDFMAAQAIVRFGSRLPSEDVQRMSFDRKDTITVPDRGTLRNNSLSSRDKHGISSSR